MKNKLANYKILHFTVFIVIGICFQHFTSFWNYSFLTTFAVLLVLALIILCVGNRKIFTILILVLFFFVGVSVVFFDDDRNYDSYYKKHVREKSQIVLKIKKVLKQGKNFYKYEAKVIQIDSVETCGIVLLNIKKDSLLSPIKVDEKIILNDPFKEIKLPLNPYIFDYKSYLSKRNIHQQIYTKRKYFSRLPYKISTVYGISALVRSKIKESLKKHNFNKDELSIIYALFLGQRQSVSKELITDYKQAGIIHILALSGLHVGIVFMILTFLLSPLQKLKNGKLFEALIIVLILWMFAFIAELSASIVRAVTMFTFIKVGMFLKTKKSVYFSLVSSAFFLLLVKPMFLFEVGFQLSYLAVFGILFFHPKIYSIWKPNYRIINYLWQLFSVSTAAQVVILPLSIYYFQQLPGLFIVSNLIVIPFLGIILISGILVIILSLLELLPKFFADFYEVVIFLLNSLVRWVSKQEEFLFKDLQLSIVLMICSYVVIFFGAYFLIKKSIQKLTYFLIPIAALQSVYLFEKKNKNSKSEIIVFHKNKHSIIGKRVGEKLYLQSDLDSIQQKNEFILKEYTLKESISESIKTDFKNFIRFKNKNILIINNLGIYKLDRLKNSLIIIQNSPKINIERLIKTLSPAEIIADGSNYKSYVLQWQKTCSKQKTPFHYTSQNGAFVIKN